MLQRLYDRYICPHLLNFIMARKPFPRQRANVVPFATGRVLEIGIGSGLNFQYYDKRTVTEIFSIDPDNILLNKAKKRSKDFDLKINFENMKAETLPFENDTFDTVLSTYTLCSIKDANQALKEVKRVLKNDGQFIFSEHGKAPNQKTHNLQVKLNPYWSRIAGGCHLDVDIPNLIQSNNFNIPELNQNYVPGPKFASYHYWGIAKQI